MPSTYSPDLRIELIANGEQSGSWGTTTNSNFGTIVEDAISGLALVSVLSANQALTALNGAADQARCAAIDLTTITTANFAVYVPPVTKLYTIKNSSAYVATVYCSTILGNTTAAGLGVVIPAGKSVLVRTDGTDVIEQIDRIGGNLSVGGDLAVGGVLTATSPAFSGNPTATTQATSDNSTRIATTAYVQAITGTLGTASQEDVGLLDNNVVQRDADNSMPVGSTWSIREVGGVLYFAVGGVNKAKLDASGNFTAVADVAAYGTM